MGNVLGAKRRYSKDLKTVRCNSCKEYKSPDSFYQRKDRNDGLSSYCKPCHLAEGKGRQQGIQLKIRYGLTVEQYDQMRSKQGHKCAICERHESEFNRALFVDHSHITGKVRGLLCSTCNFAISYFERNSDLLDNAKKYLEVFNV